MTRRAKFQVAVAMIAALVLVSGCGDSNPLVGDPMADVQIEGAERLRRRVQDPSGGSAFSKPNQAKVVQVYRASAPGAAAEAIVEQLARRAVEAGWELLPRGTFGEAATKTIPGTAARLFVNTRAPRRSC